MSDVREVTEWHEHMEGTLAVAAEQLSDSFDALIEASGIPGFIIRLIRVVSKISAFLTR